LPAFQAISKKLRGRKFVIRMGTPWQFSDPEQRWDVMMSFLAFMLALTIAMLVFDQLIPFAQLK
jgi:hypothetical protein